MKDTVLDASSVINLVNGGVFSTCLALSTRRFHIGPLVKAECANCAQALGQAVAAKTLVELGGDVLPASVYLRFAERHGLGDGETECIAFASIRSLDICCDDRRARAAIKEEIGAGRMTGSLGLLREAIGARLLDQAAAFGAYERMKQSGGFLPELQKEFFTAS